MAPNFSDDDFPVKRMAVTNDPKKCSVVRATPRLLQLLRVLSRHKFLGALLGSSHWPAPKGRYARPSRNWGWSSSSSDKFSPCDATCWLRVPPDAYIKELEQLHDQLPAMGMDEVRATVEVELGAPLATLFSAFSETPLAAATIAQVHEATLKDGRHVAVKVQRPCLKEKIATDISALTTLVALGRS